MSPEPQELDARGKQAFGNKNFDEAAEYFRRASDAYTAGGAALKAAEMKNNLSVALLQTGQARAALEAALGTDEIFAKENDLKFQAMALGNQAAALDELKRYDEAIAKYERSADLFGQIDEGDLRAMVMKSAAAVKLKTGKVTESAFKMMGSLDVKKNPGIFERILKFFMRFIK